MLSKQKLLIIVLAIILMVAGCTAEPSIQKDSAEIIHEFLTRYYEVTEEEFVAMDNATKKTDSSEQSISNLATYTEELTNQYKDIITEEELNRLNASRELDAIIKQVYPDRTLYKVIGIATETESEDPPHYYYKYKVSIESTEGTVREFSGRIRLFKPKAKYMIDFTELDSTFK